MNSTKLQYYNDLFQQYPDVVTVQIFRQMLGGISNSAARRLIKQNHVKHFCIKQKYLIPKVYIIEYILSDEYKKDSKRFMHSI